MDPSRAAAVAIDTGELSLADGLLALVRPALDRLEQGGVLAIVSRAPSLRQDLPAWCRSERHEYLGAETIATGHDRHLIARGSFSVPHGAREPSIHDPSLGVLTTGVLLARVPMPERADCSSGFAPRGARVEPGGPSYPFELVERDRV